ncbi:MAG: SAM-dependent methyltransferase [Alphaproteobacteria bacterium]|nr:SAM-dependent methyltransferase [Alphaproteobacteria bacterium]MDD9919437.1 SAM-dependent methyltransferase [Alphaproteobacteria bacterium]
MNTPLHQIILDKIQTEGPITIDTYMELCLYHPKHGFYMNPNAIGAKGHFTTAPEITPLFGETLAIWVTQKWEELGKPTAFTLAEGGPGKGTLMTDLLRTLKRISPDAYQAATVILMETSPHLRGEQAITLQNHTVDWAENLSEIPWQEPTIFIANELLDAFPIVQTLSDGTPRTITAIENELGFTDNDATHAESSPAQIEFLTALKAHLTQGVALFIDYGYTHGTGNTLQAIHKHQKVDIFHQAGESDLTAHVNFAVVAQTLGLPNCTIEDQASFLLRHGFALRATQTLETAPNDTTRQNIESACHRLIAPKEMGSLFKALTYTP